MSNQKVVIIVPTYNEALTIQETVLQIFATTAAVSGYDLHVLIFDSASTDETQAIVTAMLPLYSRLHLQAEPTKTGLGSAYWQAMHYALSDLAADVVIEFDADLSHQPKYIEPILELLDTHDVVVGSRYVPGGNIPSDWGWHRKLLSKLGNYVARAILTPKYKDFTSGFRATRRQALLTALPKRFLSQHYAYKLELLWNLHKNKASIGEYPIEFIDRQKGQSKLPTNSIVDSLRVISILRLRELKQYLNMCAIGTLGLLLQCIAYNLLRQVMPPLPANQIAVLVAIINNFTLNNRFTFKDHAFSFGKNNIRQLALFLLYSLMMIYVQGYWVALGTHYAGEGVAKENILVITGILWGSLLNYFIYSRWIWRNRLPPAR